MSRSSRRVLQIVLTDSTFERVEHRGREGWLGKCIHCNGRLFVALDGTPVSRATIEHIRPRSDGGTDALENLALSCERCNHQKGRTHDKRAGQDPASRALIERLLEKRRQRWREPPG